MITCQYCGIGNDKSSGSCRACGAPLVSIKEAKSPEINVDEPMVTNKKELSLSNPPRFCTVCNSPLVQDFYHYDPITKEPVYGGLVCSKPKGLFGGLFSFKEHDDWRYDKYNNTWSNWAWMD